jgi:beta-1,2-rhamnosyltransferase WsaF-like protein
MFVYKDKPMNKGLDILTLRAIRKTSYLSGKASKKVSSIFDRIENKTTRIIINQTGSPYGTENIDLDSYFYQNYPYLFPVHPALPKLHQKPSVTVFAFLDPRGFYGGIATLLLVAAELANKLGYDLRVAQTTGYSKDTKVLEFLRDNGIKISEDRFTVLNLSDRSRENFSYLPLHPEDVVVVSAWWDAYIASQLPLGRKFVYLIQDYEPIFYNNSDSSMFAEQTYHGDRFIPVCNTELIYDFFTEKGYKNIQSEGLWFEPAPAPNINHTKEAKNTKPKKRLFLYGRPQVHRNLFFTALNAIDLAFSDSDKIDAGDWEFYCAGQGGTPSVRLRSGRVLKNLGKMDIDKYYRFASNIDVAVSPMLAPHPNYPTLEFAALGAMVVSTKYETKKDLSRYSKNILMSEPTVDDMAQKILEACLTPQRERSHNLSTTSIGNNWSVALKKTIDTLAKRL